MTTKKTDSTTQNEPVKRRDFLKLGIQAAAAISLASIGGYFAFRKPNYKQSEKNPYDLGMDSIGIIPKDKFCKLTSRTLVIPFKESKALAVDKLDNIYVSGDKSILILDKAGKQLTKFETPITATAITIAADMKVYVAFENHISTYDSNGKHINEWAAIGDKSYITSVAISKTNLFAADAELELVHEYLLDGTFIRSIGSTDKKDIDSFVLPSYFFDVAIAPDNSLWAANTGKHKMLNFDTDGYLLSSWGETSAAVEGFCGCCNPSHFAIMQDGSFITTEKGIVRVKKYDATGKFVAAIAGPDYFQQSSTGLEIAINSENEILVLEPARNKIHIFKI